MNEEVNEQTNTEPPPQEVPCDEVVIDENKTFTKFIMRVVMFLYFLGAMVGTVLIVVSAIVDINLGLPVSNQMFLVYTGYLGGPTATAIGFYAWKSKAENLVKIHNTNTKRLGDQKIDISTLANIGDNTYSSYMGG